MLAVQVHLKITKILMNGKYRKYPIMTVESEIVVVG